ncbi:MAG: tetratricopeptide repeat-containing glycosyltransferase family protein, partial [Rhodospirillales bacterium]
VGHYRHALDCQPEQPLVWGNLAVALQESGHLDDALAAYDKAIVFDPNEPNIRRNRGMALLAAGRFDEGWADYEYRWQTPRFKRLCRDWPVPMWDGSDIRGKRILVHAEQGLGDTLQCCRYLPLLHAGGAKVIVECADSLKPLIETIPGVHTVIRPGGHLPGLDYHVPLMSLPGLFKTNGNTIPAKVPYLIAPKSAERKWQKITADWPKGKRVGIAWRGSPDHPRDVIRSPGLAHFLKLASLPDITLVSLQIDGAAGELASMSDAAMVMDPTAHINDFGDSAALVGQLDAVVSCDSAPLHLAGALGAPCYAVLPHVAEWRWGRDGDRSPWYPTMTLIRQSSFGDWDSVFARVTKIIG